MFWDSEGWRGFQGANIENDLESVLTCGCILDDPTDASSSRDAALRLLDKKFGSGMSPTKIKTFVD